MTLYRLIPGHSDLSTSDWIYPKIPLSRLDDEDGTIPRICVAENPDECLTSMGFSHICLKAFQELLPKAEGNCKWENVWTKIRFPFTVLLFEVDQDDPALVYPEDLKYFVPDAKWTREHWITNVCRKAPFFRCEDIRHTIIVFIIVQSVAIYSCLWYNVRMKYKSNLNVVYSCKYHVVWCPKYRRKVLKDGVDQRLKELIYETAAEIRVDIIEMEVMPDHVHLLMEVDPQFGVHRAVKAIKGKTSRILRDEFPTLKSRLPTLWTHSYFCSTVGGAPLSAIKQYIENQKNV